MNLQFIHAEVVQQRPNKCVNDDVHSEALQLTFITTLSPLVLLGVQEVCLTAQKLNSSALQ